LCFENINEQHMLIFSEQNAKILFVTASGKCSNNCSLRSYNFKVLLKDAVNIGKIYYYDRIINKYGASDRINIGREKRSTRKKTCLSSLSTINPA
jgi:hypothetical protein